MKQILQSLKDGRIELAEVPIPSKKTGYAIVRSRVSLVSAGTEKMLLEFGRSNLINKARQQPDKVRQVIQKIQTDGLVPTLEAVKSRLDTPLPLGYCNVGNLVSVKGWEPEQSGMALGDRVVSNGPHAQVVRVPRLLCAAVPDAVSDETAAFTVLGAIALQGIRLASPTIGETVVVSGLGLIGQLAVQILKANGCRVIGIDVDADRCALAKQFGAETLDLSVNQDPIGFTDAYTKGCGVDAVLITAATTSSKPVHQAAEMCRKRGRIVLVGVTGLQLNRSDFYEKELSFQVSCSYGPGRYDPLYENKGQDYPAGFVRWTEQRNFEAVLNLMAEGKIVVEPLISHRFSFESAADAYEMIAAGQEPYMGILLQYDGDRADALERDSVVLQGRIRADAARRATRPVIGMLGAGTFAGRILLPALEKTECDLKQIISDGGISGTHLGKKFGFQHSGTDSTAVFEDDEINTVVITTRHNNHAESVLSALAAGKHIFCEKPLCLTLTELDEIERSYQVRTGTENAAQSVLMVGFNRRFSALTQKIKTLLANRTAPICMVMTVNAGGIAADHWTQNKDEGGGRLIGEACHFIDLLYYLCGATIINKSLAAMQGRIQDTFSIQLEFEDGSIGTVHYFANGHKAYPKERLQIYCAGKVLELDNFRRLKGWGWPDFKIMKLWRQDKGHNSEVERFVEAIQHGKAAPIEFDEITSITRHTIELADTL